MAGILRRLFGNKKEKNENVSDAPTKDDNHVKILFRFYSETLEEWTVETMWAIIVDVNKGLYKLDNIPFYAPLVATHDIVFAEYDDTEERLTYRRTVEYSGNSTIHVVIMDKSTDINTIRDIFNELGCTSERLNDGYFSMEIPAGLLYNPIKKKLEELENGEIISYAESCLSSQHQY